MLSLIASAALVAAGPIEGFCLKYSIAGNNLCVMWSSESAVYVHDGLNTFRYVHVYGPIYKEHINGYPGGHHLCTYNFPKLNCLFGIEFKANEDQIRNHGCCFRRSAPNAGDGASETPPSLSSSSR